MFHIVPECSLNKGFNIFNLGKQAVNSLNSSKLALFMLVVLMVSGLTMPILMGAVTAITDEKKQNKVVIDSLFVIEFEETSEDLRTNKLLEIIETSRYQVVKTFSRIEDDGATIPDASRDKYLEGRSKEEYAIKLRDEGLYEQASLNAIEAMRKYKEAITIAEQAGTTPKMHETEIIAEKTIGLGETVTREKDNINRLEILTVEAEKKGFNVAIMRSNIRQAEAIINNGEVLLQTGNVEKASRELDAAKNIIDKSMRDLNQVTKIIKAQKAEIYFQQTEKMLHSYEQKIEESHEALTPQEQAAAKEAIQDSKIQMEEIKKDLEAGNVDDAIEGFENVEVLAEIPEDIDPTQFYQQNESIEQDVYTKETSVNGTMLDGEQVPSDNSTDVPPADEGVIDEKPTPDSSSNDTSVDEGVINGEQVPSDNSTDVPPADEGVIDEKPTTDGSSNDTSVDEGVINGEQVPSDNSTDVPSTDEGIVDEEQIILNGYSEEKSIDNNVIEEKQIQAVTPDPEPNLSLEENSKSIDDNSIKTRFSDEESVRADIENEKMSIEKEYNKKPIEKKLAQDNSEQKLPTPYKSQQDNLKQNDPKRDMQVDQNSIDQKKIDKKSIPSDNYIFEKPIDKDSSIKSKKSELDVSTIIRENKNNHENSQVDKSQFIQEWSLEMKDDQQDKYEIN